MTTKNKYPTCKERVRGKYKDRIAEIRKLWNLYREGSETADEGGHRWSEYGLGFDYVPAGTFSDQDEGFFRFQLSWGGPGDEFRFYCDAEARCYRVEYWFMDWFDGASVTLQGRDKALLLEIFDDFEEMGMLAKALTDAD